MPRTIRSPAITGTSRSLVSSDTTELQEETELECQPFYVNLRTFTTSDLNHLRQVGLLPPRNDTAGEQDDDQAWAICLLYQKHADYLHRVFETSTTPLAASFVSLDASHPWMIYWCLQGCDLLLDDPYHPKDSRLPHNLLDVVNYLEHCWQTSTVYLDPNVVQQDSILTSIVAHEANTTNNTNRIALTGGGFGGGPGQMPHCATTYASILSLCIIATTTPNEDDAGDVTSSSKSLSSAAAWKLLEKIRLPFYTWLVALFQPDGGFAMHIDGEVDVRAGYIALCCTKLLGLLTKESVLLKSNKALNFFASCQTYEGGFGSEPGSEAHSGYAFCAMAALQFLLQYEQESQDHEPSNWSNESVLHRIDVTALRDWLARRQMSYEGGFSGRTNKLVDGCYSFWQGGSICIMEHWLSVHQQAKGKDYQHRSGEEYDPWISSTSWGNKATWATTVSPEQSTPSAATAIDRPLLLMDQTKLQRYILLCCQDAHGGLRDKPSKSRDFYHSCYVLSGLSVSQSQLAPSPQVMLQEEGEEMAHETETMAPLEMFGHRILSRVHATHPCYNIRVERVRQVLQYFRERPVLPPSGE